MYIYCADDNYLNYVLLSQQKHCLNAIAMDTANYICFDQRHNSSEVAKTLVNFYKINLFKDNYDNTFSHIDLMDYDEGYIANALQKDAGLERGDQDNRDYHIYKISSLPCSCTKIQAPYFLWFFNIINISRDWNDYNPEVANEFTKYVQFTNVGMEKTWTPRKYTPVVSKHFLIPFGIPYGQKFSPSFQEVCCRLQSKFLSNKQIAKYYEKDGLKYKPLPKGLRMRLHGIYLKSVGYIDEYNKDMIVPNEMIKFSKIKIKLLDIKKINKCYNLPKKVTMHFSNNTLTFSTKLGEMKEGKKVPLKELKLVQNLDDVESILLNYYFIKHPLNVLKDYQNLIKSNKTPKIKINLLRLKDLLSLKANCWVKDSILMVLKRFFQPKLFDFIKKLNNKNRRLYRNEKAEKCKQEIKIKEKNKLYKIWFYNVIHDLKMKFKMQQINQIKMEQVITSRKNYNYKNVVCKGWKEFQYQLINNDLAGKCQVYVRVENKVFNKGGRKDDSPLNLINNENICSKESIAIFENLSKSIQTKNKQKKAKMFIEGLKNGKARDLVSWKRFFSEFVNDS